MSELLDNRAHRVHIVERILDDFRSGRQSVAEFWIDFRARARERADRAGPRF